MRRLVTAFVLAVPLLGSACGGDDGTGHTLCDDYRAKLAECHITISGGTQCDPGASAEQKCDTQCVIDLPCIDIINGTKESPYLACQMTCAGVPDGFVCDDFSAFLSKNSVCDGRPQCPDASDEKNCGQADAGPNG